MDLPEAKKIKILQEGYDEVVGGSLFSEVRSLVTRTLSSSNPTGRNLQIGNDIAKARSVLDGLGFRTGIVKSPRVALTIFRDSCTMQEDNGGGSDDDPSQHRAIKKDLLAVLGCRPPHEQEKLEVIYKNDMKQIYCLLLYCKRLRQACRIAVDKDRQLYQLLSQVEEDCRNASSSVQKCRAFSLQVSHRMTILNKSIIKADPGIRDEQLRHEFDRILWHNATYSNALLQVGIDLAGTRVKEVYLKKSSDLRFERFIIYLYDEHLDQVKPPPRFTWIPCLPLAIERGPEAIAKAMTSSFWSQLLRQGYFPTATLRRDMSNELEKYFLHGICRDTSVPLLLNARFAPQYPLCFYLSGKAGSGKSILIRRFPYALNAVLEQYLDPEIMVRFVKQNLNKAFQVLKLELELRPNNNDLSIMSIIQRRRLTMGQSKPGLVVVGLEEMPNNRAHADPNQLLTAQLISQRFSGRKGDYGDGQAPRNSTKRGISGDASVIPIFTSNYDLEKPCLDALCKLQMFSNLRVIAVQAVSGHERKIFAKEYFRQALHDRCRNFDPSCTIQLDMEFGEGDTRPLVRRLRMIVFYAAALINGLEFRVHKPVISVSLVDRQCCIKIGSETMCLEVTSKGIVVPVDRQLLFDENIPKSIEKWNKDDCASSRELSAILDFWMSKTLTPVVILSSDRDKIRSIFSLIRMMEGVSCIESVDVAQYKMMKSLYDRNETPNLRADIMRFGREALVATELLCETVDAQLRIREMIEDTPSMTAFSTEGSALSKAGLLFCVYVRGEITPEIVSRASICLD